MTEQERMLAGQLYDAGNPELAAARDRAKRLTWRYNQMDPTDYAGRTALLRELLGRLGEGSWIEPSFRCDYGTQISIGDAFFANYDCVFLDVAPIAIGDHVMFGPGCACIPPGTPWTRSPGIPVWNSAIPSRFRTAYGWVGMWWCCQASPSEREPWWPPGPW